MSKVFIPKTTDTPNISMDPEQAKLEIEGNSYPENAVEFYQPVYNWINGYFTGGKQSLSAIFKINYFNTSSAKCILHIMHILQEYHAGGKAIRVLWCYDEDDEDMMETGKAFSVDFSMPFDFQIL